MNDVTYAVVSDIENYTPISKNLKSELVEPFIKMAETFHIRPILGENLDNSLLAMISGDTLSGASYTLVQEYIIPASLWFSLFEALPFIWVRMNNRGLQVANDEKASSVDKKSYETLKQEMLDKATEYLNRLIDYLNDNTTTFPLYGNCKAGKSNSTGIFLG